MNTDKQKILNLLADICDEMARAMEQHGDFTNFHEAYAVILEELDEVWDHVKTKHPNPDAMRKELIQTAAMCLKTILCLIDKENNEF